MLRGIKGKLAHFFQHVYCVPLSSSPHPLSSRIPLFCPTGLASASLLELGCVFLCESSNVFNDYQYCPFGKELTAVSIEEVCTISTFYLGYCPKRGGEGNLIGILFLTPQPFLHLIAVSLQPHRTQVRGESCLFVFPLEPLSHHPWERRV